MCDEAEVTEQNFESMREAMVSNQLRTTAVNDVRVVDAMRAVPREAFVPANRAEVAYVDTLVPLGGGRSLNSPMATGRLLTEAQPRATDRALIVGSATGYAAALLSGLVAHVVALEEDVALVTAARSAGLPANVELVQGPLAAGWAQGAPYDLILVDGAIETLPQALVDQLGEEGRLAAAVVERGVSRLSVGRKVGGAFGLVAFADAEAAPLPGFAKPAVFKF
ncbi:MULTISPECIES: protein-L-isoaspartate O-methyltransferase family protein [Edaphosphingomonas]|uniref:Protein-L-isoaspartate O-methyltransferase n=1 Tax=Edaphosphingomonas fennica TaxID=114404 RepID=A0A2T4HR59_9SPHN|nr:MULTISPECIES: protein-L-isoaspartate O-methyltransferase [Sphingomonas]MDX3883310.1 protein-L-isoaspartate O-methyltransferase [Sphingomonas sp.]PTD18290.1 protein-L-isoaspartate O-methyltransferase [Sphingomonas fennica]